ncbi:MAG: hypothetical protein JWN72_1013, partial [Thermoleophilia bacterium]|nr:hypothetical protein [Thermoleophilia bacterium]
ALGVQGNRCTQVAISQTGEIIFNSLGNPGVLPGGAMSSTTPNPGAGGWGLMNTTAAAGADQLRGVSAPSDLVVWMVGSAGRIVQSIDGGCNWASQPSGTGQRLNGVSAPTTTIAWAAGNNGVIIKTTNGGATWSNQPSSTTQDLLEISAASTNVAWAVGKGGTIEATTNGGATWVDQVSPTNMELRSVRAVSTTVAWAAGKNEAILRTTNGGATWVQVSSGSTDLESIAAIDANTAWAVGQNGLIMKTTNGGASWANIGPPAGGGGVRLRAVDFVDASNGWITGDNGTIWRTTNGGATWVAQVSPTTGAIHGLDARSTTLAFGSATAGDGLKYTVGGLGNFGWVTEQPGGTTLPAGPWTIGGRICRDQNSGGRTFGLRARLWKVKLDGAGNITQSTALTSAWSPVGGSITLGGLTCGNATTTFSAAQVTNRSLAPTEFLYVEYALSVQSSVAAETVSLVVADPGTYIDFGVPNGNSNTAPAAPGAVTVTPAPAGAWSVSAGNTPTFGVTPAAAPDPDSFQHVAYQVCTNATCGAVYRSGTSANGLVFGDTTTSWGPVAVLPDGQYWVRARTEEESDGVNPQLGVSAWTAAVMFRIDTTGPPAATPINDGSTAGVDAAYSVVVGQLAANWTATTDVTGVAQYDYCFATAASCAAPLPGSTGVTAALNVTKTGLTLTTGQTYYFCARAQDGAGNWGPWGCSNGQLYDPTPPGAFSLITPTNPVLPYGAPTGGALACEGVPTYPTGTPTLDWTDAADSSLVEYRSYFDPSNAFPLAPTSVPGAPPVSTTMLGPQAAGAYWWKVSAHDLPGNLTWNTPGPPTPQVQVGIDLAAPFVTFGAAPADNAWVTTATPALGFSGTDDRCLARLQVWIDDATESGAAPAANLNGSFLSMTPGALADGAHLWHVRAVDVTGRSTRTAPADRTVRIDTQDPVSTITWPTGPTGGAAVTFTGTATDPLKNGSASGIASWRLRWSANVAGPWTTMVAPGCTGAAPGAINCSWNSTVVPADGNYYFQLETTDVAGRTWSTTSAATNIDNTAPSISFNAITPAGGSASDFWWPGGASSTLYYRPAGSGTPTVRFNAADFNGVTVAYPTIGGGFSPGGAGVGPSPFGYAYTFASAAGVTGTQTVTATDGAGRTNTATFRVEADSAAPVGATVDYLDGYLGGPVPPSPANSISFAKGTDFGGAGVGPNRSDLESWIIQREEGDLVAGACNWGAVAWTTAPALTNPAASPVTDPLPAANDKCYQYRIVVTDHVGNQTITANAGALKVTRTDWTPPTPFALQPPTNPALPAITTGQPAPGCGATPTFATGTPALDWTDSTDSSLAEYRVYFDPSNAFPLAFSSVGGATPASNLTLPATAAGLYWWKVAARDVPNNLTWNNPGLPTPQVQVGVDVAAPAISATAPTDNAWVTTAAPPLSWTASDDRCLARVQVWLDNAGEAGAPTAVAAGTESAYMPTPLTDGPHLWHLRAFDVADHRTVTADRTVKVDTQDPTSTITWPATPNGGSAVAFTGTATDPLKNGSASGVASWRLRWSSAATGPWTTMTDPGCTGVAGGAINCNWNSNAVPTDGNYFFQLDVTDTAGRSWSTVSTAVNIDNTPPAISFNSYTPVGGAATNAWWPGAPSSTLYYRSGGAGTFSVLFNASDFN